MPQSAIFGPFFAMLLLVFVVWIYLYVRRIHWIKTSAVTPAQLAVPGALAQLSPAAANNPSDNFKNLFEVPVLFYAVCLYLHAVGQVDGAYVAAAWVFVGFRALHSAMHCTVNIIMVRFYLYLFSTLALIYMAGRAGLAYLSG